MRVLRKPSAWGTLPEGGGECRSVVKLWRGLARVDGVRLFKIRLRNMSGTTSAADEDLNWQNSVARLSLQKTKPYNNYIHRNK